MRLLLLFILTPLFPIVGSSQQAKIATFNAEFLSKKKVHIKYGLPFDMKKANNKDQKFWNNDENRIDKLKEATDSVAGFIKKMDADIVTLTEVGNREDIDLLDKALRDIGLEIFFECGFLWTDSNRSTMKNCIIGYIR